MGVAVLGGGVAMASGPATAPALSSSSPHRIVTFLYPVDELPVTFLRGGSVRLEHAIVFADIDGIHVTPDQYVSDGTSSPAISWPVLGHRLSYSLLPPSIQHDYQLDDALQKRAAGLPHESRYAIDCRFYRALRAWGNGRVRAFLHFAGSRLKALTIGPNWDGEGFTA